MSFFEKVDKAPVDPIFGLAGEFKADKNPLKVDLMVGVYRDANLALYVFESTYEAEKRLIHAPHSKDYLPFEGDPLFLQKTKELLFGSASLEKYRDKIAMVQAVGGTGALSMGGVFLRNMGFTTIYLSDPTWPNHGKIFSMNGLEIKVYPYFDVAKSRPKIKEMLAFLNQLEKGSLVLLHTSCHNPSGIDPTQKEWEEICAICKKRGLLVFFDTAYQGLGEGLEEDVYPIRLFLQEGLEFLSTHSFSKNFGLYGERVATLSVVCREDKMRENVFSQLKSLVRGSFSNPPRHGAEIVSCILSHADLHASWQKELNSVRLRLKKMREQFVSQLEKACPSLGFSSIAATKGMFAFTGLSKEHVEKIRKESGVYMTGNGRINLSGLSDQNIDYVINAIKGYF